MSNKIYGETVNGVLMLSASSTPKYKSGDLVDYKGKPHIVDGTQTWINGHINMFKPYDTPTVLGAWSYVLVGATIFEENLCHADEHEIGTVRERYWDAKYKASKSPKEGFVYLYQPHGEDTPILIGRTSTNASVKRLKALNRKWDAPKGTQFLLTIPHDDIFAFELYLHRVFSTKHVANKWFNLTEADVASIKEECL